MATLTVMPVPVMQFLADLTGQPLANGKVYTYAAGTTTPLQTFTDAAGLVPNSNPITLDAFGKAIIFLSTSVYKFDVQNAAGVSQDGYPRDNIVGSAPANTLGGIQYTFPIADGSAGQFLQTNGSKVLTWATPSLLLGGYDAFRLSLTTGVPVTTADVLAATTLFCTPYTGNQLVLYDTSGVPTLLTSAQFSIAVPATTSQLYDIFAFNSGGTPTLELLAWTNDTTRATAVVLTTTGVWTKSGDLTRRYLGSFRTTAVSGQTESSFAKRYLWNAYNRVPVLMRAFEPANSWTYTTNTYRQMNANAANQLDCVIGIADVMLDSHVVSYATNDTASITGYTSIGEDSASTPASNVMGQNGAILTAASGAIQLQAYLQKYPAVGRHFYAALERSTAGTGTTTWYGTNADTTKLQAGIVGVILG